jgi:hypothetical protein
VGCATRTKRRISHLHDPRPRRAEGSDRHAACRDPVAATRSRLRNAARLCHTHAGATSQATQGTPTAGTSPAVGFSWRARSPAQTSCRSSPWWKHRHATCMRGWSVVALVRPVGMARQSVVPSCAPTARSTARSAKPGAACRSCRRTVGDLWPSRCHGVDASSAVEAPARRSAAADEPVRRTFKSAACCAGRSRGLEPMPHVGGIPTVLPDMRPFFACLRPPR